MSLGTAGTLDDSSLNGGTTAYSTATDTVSLTMLEGGYKINVIPERAEMSFDCRLLPDTDPRAFVSNIQQLVSGLQWGLDNWVYGCAGGAGGTIHSAEKPDRPAVLLRGRA